MKAHICKRIEDSEVRLLSWMKYSQKHLHVCVCEEGVWHKLLKLSLAHKLTQLGIFRRILYTTPAS